MSNVTTERTPSKRSNIKTQFQIRDASDVSCSPVTPVRIAPPPVTVKRSKSLKTERCGTLKRHHTPLKAPIVLPTPVAATTEDDNTDVNIEVKKEVHKPLTRQCTEPVIPHDNTNVNTSPPDKCKKLPEQSTWQAVVNTHRRGSSMTFETTQNWAQFDQVEKASSKSVSNTPSRNAASAIPNTTAPPTPSAVAPAYDWSISSKQWASYEDTFHKVKPLHGFLSGKQAREFLLKSNLSNEDLSNILDLSDMDHDGSLSLVEFAVAMHTMAAMKSGEKVPKSVPSKLTESLIHHIHNKNIILSSNKDDDTKKSPEKSSLKSDCSISRGTSVTFKEDTLIRSRPRPVRKAASICGSSPGGARVQLDLKPHYCHSSSSYYSSDYESSDSEESELGKRRSLDMGSSEKKKKRGKRSKKDADTEKLSEGDKNEEKGENSRKVVRRERTYDDPDEVLKRLHAADEDVEALIQQSDEEPAPPSRPPPPRTSSIRVVPSSTPPTLALASTLTSPPPSTSPPACMPPSNSPPSCAPPSGNSSDITSSGGVHSSDGTPQDTDEPSAKAPQGYERLPEQIQDQEPRDSDILTPEEGGEVIDSDDDFYNAGDGFKRTQNRVRTASMDISNLLDKSGNACPEDPKHYYQSTEPADICVIKTDIDIDELKAEVDELKADFPNELFNLRDIDIDYDKIPANEANLDELRQKDLQELRSQLRNIEIHNNALIGVTRELKIELIKAKEQKLHLHSMLQYLKDE